MKALIMYYSKSGKTEELANRIKKNLDCDILKIEPEKSYGSYFWACCRVGIEKIKKTKVKFKNEIPELNNYDVVLIGYPIWWFDIPSFIAEFLNNCDLKGKKIIPFATSGNTNISKTMKTIKIICNESEIIFPFTYSNNKKDNYEDWIKSIKKIR